MNNDGTMDVVLTDLQGRLNCLMNDGTGRMSKRSCGDTFAFGIELGDIDGDGHLDVVYGAHEYEGSPTGVALNDGTGIFRKSWTLPSINGWGTVPEVAVWDLNEDGKLDIVLSRAGVLYAGTAIEVLENLGEGRFRSQFFPLVEPPAGYDATAEANEWNNFVHSIRFSDVDLDGHTDILLIANGRGPHAAEIHGSILRNSGNMTFEHVRNRTAGNPVKVIEESRFLDDPKLILSRLEPAQGAPTVTSASRAFQSAIKGLEVPDSDMASYVDIPDPIQLPESGAAIVGVKDFQMSQGRGSFGLLISWGGELLPIEVCVESYLANKFTAYRVRFSESGFGGVSAFNEVGTHSCMGQPGYAGDWELAPEGERMGIRALLRDISTHGKSIIVGLPELSDQEKIGVISDIY
ncbi:FG-GAP repeat domain-containing protein [Devosia honganensis]|uniref:FG-GAP repeat domain-containing protein n=1 Tax=Devosia honganensis TaxID=1610527 RepID=A0ABV7X0L7_9HYPH